MTNSGVLITANLVHTQEISYSESGDIATDLGNILNSSEITELRTLYGADFVVLLVDCDCSGVGYLTLNGDYAYNVTDIDYIPFFTFHHEIGHNCNLEHDWDNATSVPNRYNYGFKECNTAPFFRTVMSYDCAGSTWA